MSRLRTPSASTNAALKAHCERKLKEAELKVEKIVQGPGGAIGLEPADDL